MIYRNDIQLFFLYDIDIDIADRAGRIRAIQVNDELMGTGMNLRLTCKSSSSVQEMVENPLIHLTTECSTIVAFMLSVLHPQRPSHRPPHLSDLSTAKDLLLSFSHFSSVPFSNTSELDGAIEETCVSTASRTALTVIKRSVGILDHCPLLRD